MSDHFRTASPDWESLRFFLILARHGTLSAAARALGVNHATVARRLAALEAALGISLLLRRPDGYHLTPAGQQVMEAAARMEGAAAQIAQTGPGAEPVGLVRISATPSLAERLLAPALAQLAISRPGLDVELQVAIRTTSLARRAADLALRLGPTPDSELIGRRLTPVASGYYASPAIAERLAAGEAPTFVTFDEAGADLPEAVWLTRHFPAARRSIRAGTQETQARAAAAGAGVALIHRFIGDQEPGLVPVPLWPEPPPRSLTLLATRRSLDDPAIRVVADHVSELLRQR